MTKKKRKAEIAKMKRLVKEFDRNFPQSAAFEAMVLGGIKNEDLRNKIAKIGQKK